MSEPEEPITHKIVIEFKNDTGFGVSAEGLKALSSLRVTPVRRTPTYGSKEYSVVALDLTQREYDILMPILIEQGVEPKPQT